jgi:hypothetical protein
VHDERQSPDRPGRLDSLAFDDSDEGERLRRYQLAHGRIFLRTVTTIFKVRKEVEDCDRGADDRDTVGRPGILATSIGWGEETQTIPSDSHVELADGPGIPAEAGTPAPPPPDSRQPAGTSTDDPHPLDSQLSVEASTDDPHPLESRLQAESSADDSGPLEYRLQAESFPEGSGRLKPGLQPGNATDPLDPRLPEDSRDLPDGETNPMPVGARLMPPLDPCSEGRHVESAIDSAPGIPTVSRPRTPPRTTAGRRSGSNSLPPTIIRLLSELVMRQAITGGPTPLRGQGRFGGAGSP